MNKDELEGKGFYTINKLSEITGSDRRSLKKYLASELPDHKYRGSNYYELNRVHDLLEDASSKGSDKQKLECKKLVAQIKNIELRNSEISRRVIPSSEIAKVWSLHVGKARSVLLGMEDLAPLLCGLSVNEIKAKIKQATKEVIEALNECPVDESKADRNTK